MAEVVNKRYEFVVLFDVENGNPNGDPDAGNMPRIDPETSLGLVTDVCLKRKIRNYVDLVKNGDNGYDIYVREGGVLNLQHKKAYNSLGIDSESKKLPKDKDEARKLMEFMCRNFFDIRTFGAVMSTEINCGQIRGPVQLNFARSIEPIVPQEITITRMAVTSEKDAEKKDREMGKKHIIPYALYRVEGYVSAHLAQNSKFTFNDLELLWDALLNMFEHDRSAARGKMATRMLVIFEHATAFGNAPAHRLFDCIKIKPVDINKPARSYNDYIVEIDKSMVPDLVKVIVRE